MSLVMIESQDKEHQFHSLQSKNLDLDSTMFRGQLLWKLLVYYVVALNLFLLPQRSEACVRCFHPGSIPHKHNQHQSHAITAVASSPARGFHPYSNGFRTNSIAVATTAAQHTVKIFREKLLSLRQSLLLPKHQRALRLSASAAIVTSGMVVIARQHIPATMKNRINRGLWRNQLEDEEAIEPLPGDETAEPNPEKEEVDATSSAMIATIGVYKNFISPLLPPACRFVPTCSQYGVQAIEKYGPGKGVILTSWRLLRCSPFGGKGYDPPKWPPVSYTYSSY